MLKPLHVPESQRDSVFQPRVANGVSYPGSADQYEIPSSTPKGLRPSLGLRALLGGPQDMDATPSG